MIDKVQLEQRKFLSRNVLKTNLSYFSKVLSLFSINSPSQIMENAELTSMVKILGLKYGKKYETDSDIATLRYGKIMIMADQDVVRNFVCSGIENVSNLTPGLVLFFYVSVFSFIEVR